MLGRSLFTKQQYFKAVYQREAADADKFKLYIILGLY